MTSRKTFLFTTLRNPPLTVKSVKKLNKPCKYYRVLLAGYIPTFFGFPQFFVGSLTSLCFVVVDLIWRVINSAEKAQPFFDPPCRRWCQLSPLFQVAIRASTWGPQSQQLPTSRCIKKSKYTVWTVQQVSILLYLFGF